MIFVETKRLLLRKVAKEDFPYFRDYLMDKEMDRMMLRSSCDTEKDVQLGFDWFLNKEERAYVIVNKETGSVVGNLTVYNRPPSIVAEQDVVKGKTGRSLSFAIAPAWQRKGFIHEALCAVIDHLFCAENADYINCGYLSFNEPSRKLQEKLGFAYLTQEQFTLEGKHYAAIENILWRP